MLTPSKHSHPDATVVAAATAALEALRRDRVLRFDELAAVLAERVRGEEYLLIPAVSFLFLLDLIEYRSVNDSFEYVGP